MMQTNNPPVTLLLRIVTAVEVLILVITGVGLIVVPDTFRPLWPWQLTPFNTFFLGAVYLGALVAAFMLTYHGRWSPAREVLPLIFLFTMIVLIISALNLQNFTPNSLSTWLWFILYAALPLNAGYHLWLYRSLRPVEAPTLPPLIRYLLLAQAVVLTLYGVGLLIAPATFSAFWPWRLDDFHARLYSVAFVVPAASAFVLYRAAPRLELLTQGWAQIIGGGFAIAGLFIVDSTVHRVDWSLAGTWFWISFSALQPLMGVVMLWQARRR
jgi:hypothetical protein